MTVRRGILCGTLLLLALTVVPAVRADRFTTSETSIHLDEPAPARTLDPQPNALALSPGQVLRCATYTGVKGVPVSATVLGIPLVGEIPVPTPIDEVSSRTRKDGWSAPYFFNLPTEDDALLALYDSVLSGGKDLDGAMTQCTVGLPQECVPSETTGCISTGGKDRFKVELTWTDFFDGSQRPGIVGPPTDDGLLFFFSQNNFEMVVKVLDLCSDSLSNRFWVFYGTTTNVEIELTVTDTVTGVVRSYVDQVTPAETITDTTAFATCP